MAASSPPPAAPDGDPVVTTPPPPDLFPYFRTVIDVNEVIDWAALFGNDHPVEIDIGCGRGLFLLTASLAHPERNYLGVELDYTVGRRAAKRLQKRSLPNARLFGGDVRILLTKWIRPHSLDAAHVYFPDPWWKRRHMRRRLFTDVFVDQVSRVLKPGAILHSWTDVEDYFHVISGLMNHHPDFETLPPPDERAPEHDLDYQTNFERRKRKDGLPIYRGQWRRRPLA